MNNKLKHQALNVIKVDIEFEIKMLNTKMVAGGIAKHENFKKSFP
tara:strand:+ start:803 stop:937 length:135 start_codon:yes stop_codon:yes gene_type:complete